MVNCPGRWIGRGSRKAWPPRLSDQMPWTSSYEAALKIKLMSLLYQTIFRNLKTGFVKLWNPLTQIPYAKHRTSSRIVWMWLGLPVEPTSNTYKLRKKLFELLFKKINVGFCISFSLLTNFLMCSILL
jgi:hypothetical protein